MHTTALLVSATEQAATARFIAKKPVGSSGVRITGDGRRHLLSWVCTQRRIYKHPSRPLPAARPGQQRTVVLPGSASALTTTSELGVPGDRTTEIRWSPRWLLVHSWSACRGSTGRGGASGAPASRKSACDVMDEPARGVQLHSGTGFKNRVKQGRLRRARVQEERLGCHGRASACMRLRSYMSALGHSTS